MSRLTKAVKLDKTDKIAKARKAVKTDKIAKTGKIVKAHKTAKAHRIANTDKTVKALAREHTAAAIETLASILKNTAATESSRVQAATALLDRGWGKPLQQLEVGEAGAFSDMDETSLDAFIAHAAARLSSHGAGSGSRPH